MRNPSHVVTAAKALRDSLELSGKHPELLGKLNAILDLEHIGILRKTRLQQLIAQAEQQ